MGNSIFWGAGSWLIAAGLQMSGYTNPYVAAILFLMGIVCFLMAIPDIKKISFKSIALPSKLIPLDKAARILYEKTEKTSFNQQLSSSGKTPEQIMRRFKYSLMTSCKLYGETPLSGISRLINNDGSLQPQDNNILSYHYDNTPVYTNVNVEKKDLNEYIRRLNKKPPLLPRTASDSKKDFKES